MTRRQVVIDIPAPYFPPVRDRKTGRLKPVPNTPKIPGNTRKCEIIEAAPEVLATPPGA